MYVLRFCVQNRESVFEEECEDNSENGANGVPFFTCPAMVLNSNLHDVA